MMKKNFKRLLSVAMCLLLSLSTVFTAVGCGPEEEIIDTTKVNIYVTAYDGGYGIDWLEKTADYFMDKYKDTQFGELKGVDIHITKDRSLGNSFVANYAILDQDIYFVPGGDYFEITDAGCLLDVTDIFTEIPEENKLPGGTNKSIVDNMNPEVRDYLGIDKNGTKHYYAMPAQGTGFGFNYDVDMFFNYGLYYVDGHTQSSDASEFITPIHWDDVNDKGEYTFINADGKTETVLGDVLSTGPDGEYGTSDDGEPEYYTDFLNLCLYMKTEKTIHPCTFMKGSEAYVYDTASQLMYDHLGPEYAAAYRDGEGKISNVVGFNGDQPIVEEYDLSAPGADKVRLFKNDGMYWATYLIGKIFENKYYSNKITSEYTHLDAQYDLLLSSKRNTNNSNRVAFLLDGAYWEHEAMQNGLYNDAVDRTGDDYFKYENRKFKLLANPKVDGTELGKPCVSGVGANYGVVLDKVREKGDVHTQVVKMFFQTIFSDVGNMYYTEKTSLCRPMSFPIDEEGMTYYGKIIRELYTVKADVVNNLTKAKWNNEYNSLLASRWCTSYQGKDYDRQIIELFLNQGCPIKDYFNGIYTRQVKRFGTVNG